MPQAHRKLLNAFGSPVRTSRQYRIILQLDLLLLAIDSAVANYTLATTN